MSDLSHWFKYHIGDMEFELRFCSALAEGIAHRLMRAYWRRGDSEIEPKDTNLAKLAKVSVADFQSIRHEMEDVMDMDGPVLRIRFLDSLAEAARKTSLARSKAGKKGAERKWRHEALHGEKSDV